MYIYLSVPNPVFYFKASHWPLIGLQMTWSVQGLSLAKPPYNPPPPPLNLVSVLLSTLVKSFGVSRMRNFLELSVENKYIQDIYLVQGQFQCTVNCAVQCASALCTVHWALCTLNGALWPLQSWPRSSNDGACLMRIDVTNLLSTVQGCALKWSEVHCSTV